MGCLAPILKAYVVLLLLSQHGRAIHGNVLLSCCPGTALDNISWGSSFPHLSPMGQPHIPSLPKWSIVLLDPLVAPMPSPT